MPGTGKSTLIAELAARGYRAVDADEDGLSHVVTAPDDGETGLDPGSWTRKNRPAASCPRATGARAAQEGPAASPIVTAGARGLRLGRDVRLVSGFPLLGLCLGGR